MISTENTNNCQKDKELNDNPDPHVFLNSPCFRKDAIDLPTAKEWQRIMKGHAIEGECIVHPTQRVKFRGKRQRVRRLIYHWCVETIDEEDQVDKTCKTEGCVFPLHLKAKKISQSADGIFQMWKNREKDTRLTQKERAQKYGISQYAVRRKDQGKSYRHLPLSTKPFKERPNICLDSSKNILNGICELFFSTK